MGTITLILLGIFTFIVTWRLNISQTFTVSVSDGSWNNVYRWLPLNSWKWLITVTQNKINCVHWISNISPTTMARKFGKSTSASRTLWFLDDITKQMSVIGWASTYQIERTIWKLMWLDKHQIIKTKKKTKKNLVTSVDRCLWLHDHEPIKMTENNGNWWHH